MSEELYGKIGRQQVELEAMHNEYTRLLSLLQKVVSGEIVESRVTVDIAAKTWAVTDPIKEA